MSIEAAITHLIANRHSKAGTMPLGDRPLLERDGDYNRQIALKTDLLARFGRDVFDCRQGHDDSFQAVADRFGAPDFKTLCMSVQEDLLLLVPDGDGIRLQGGGLFFPSKWALADKIGKPLDLVHGPVPSYQDGLAATVNRLLLRLPEGQVLLRYNWTLHDDAALFQHPHLTAKHAPATSPDQLWFRSERQTLSRVGGTGAILFTIKTLQARLPEVLKSNSDLGPFLADEIAGMDETTLSYKSLTDKRDALLVYLA